MLDIVPELFDVLTLYTLYKNENRTDNSEEEQRLRDNITALRTELGEEQRRQLMRIIDDKDLVCAKDSQHYYTKGFRRAMILMAECFLEN